MSDPQGPKAPEQLPRLRLDELLDELQTRIDTVRGTQDRIQSLLEAILSVGGELNLSQVLRRVVEVAVALVDAEYGALGVLGDDKRLTQFLTVGVSEDQVREIGPLPSGHGILGELISHPQPLRLAELSGHPSSYGFPSNHPPMRSFVGVPVKVRDEVFGNLYLTEKRGGEEFDGEDETMLTTLAVAAGVAIENARLYEDAQQRQRWIQGAADVTRRLLSGAEDIPVLEQVVERAREILGADLGVIATPDDDCGDGCAEGDGSAGELRVAVAIGTGAVPRENPVVPVNGSLLGTAYTTQEPVAVTDASGDPLITAGPPHWAELGPTLVTPLRVGDGVRGALLLARPRGARDFTPDEATSLTDFTGQTTLAIELAERRRDTERIALFEDRERIARDLHDLAIQRLFATGMTLQSTMPMVDHPEAAERLTQAVDDLDETIKIIRSAIFGLRNGGAGPVALGLRARAAQAIDECAEPLGLTPTLRIEGLVDTEVPHDVADAALAVIGEALSNVARHAEAGTASVSLKAGPGEFSVVVTDDGVGLTEESRRSGLRNLGERAEELGGALDLTVPDSGGTRLVWHVPLSVA